MKALVWVFAAVAVLLFVAAAVLVFVSIADGTFGLPGSTTQLASSLCFVSLLFSFAGIVLKHRSVRALARSSDPVG